MTSSVCGWQVVDASISESIFNMLEACIPEYVHHGHVRPPSGSTISGAAQPHPPSQPWGVK